MTNEKVPSFEKEKIVQVRLGIRLKRIFWPLDMGIVNDMLDKLGYRDIVISGNQLIDAKKSDVSFYLDHTKMVFGFMTRNIEKLISAQKDFFALADREYKTNLNDSVRFYELEYISNYYTEKKVHEVLQNVYSDSNQISKYESITEQQLIPKGIELVSKNETVHSDKFFSITIDPKFEATNNVYYCRIIYRDNSQQTVYAYAKKCSDTIKESVATLENQ